MAKICFYLTTIFIFFMNIACPFFIGMDYVDRKLKVYNRSDVELGILINFWYPDTSIVKTEYYNISPNDTNTVGILNRRWRGVLERKDTVTVYIVNWDELKTEEFKTEEIDTILKKYFLTESYLDSVNWLIEYP